MEFTIEQIAQLLGGEVEGNSQLKINDIAKIEEGKPGTISFLSNPKYEPFIYSTQSSAVIVAKTFVPKTSIQTTLIRVEDPYAAFTALLTEYQRILSLNKIGIEEPVYTGSESTFGENIYRGAFSYVGRGCKIGNNVKLYPHVYIGDGVEIGDNTVIYAGVKIYQGVKIGRFCTIQAGAVIGSDGFGYAPLPDGSYKNIPQLGIVILEDHVDIGANTTVDRATLGATVIKQGVKLDNLIQIAHNVEIGEHTVIAAQSGVSGSTKIGSGCVIAGQVGLVGHIKVANKTSIGAQSGISKSIDVEGTKIQGSPAFDYNANLKSIALFRKLPDLQKRIERLEKNILTLNSKK
jgi:UDP-3-O-[3-hydroxymyristoyl] glucosamine N-acyltransferase